MRSTKVAILLLLVQWIFLPACKKSFIDISDPTRIVTSDYYKDSTSIAAAVIAAYSSLQDIYGKSGGNRGIWPFAEVASDNSTSVVDGVGVGDFENFGITSANAILQSQWTATYKCVARCNLVLARAPAVNMNAAVKARYLAEMKFLRALAYFNAVRIWGDFPLVTKEIETVQDAYTYGRTPADSVYKQIVQDLTDAEGVLPVSYATADLGRATQEAAKGLLSKVYLTLKEYDLAGAKLQEFITLFDNKPCKLLTPYSSIFLTSNEMNAEIIFAVRYTKGGYGTGSPFTNYFAASSSLTGGIGNAGQYNTITPDLYSAFVANDTLKDKRYAASMGYFVGVKEYYTKKYTDVPASDGDADCDWIVLRYADVLLMNAEVLNEQGNTGAALPYINRVRERAGLADLPGTVTQDSLRVAIGNERRLELNMEGHRWFDLVRTGQAITVMNNYFAKYGSAVRIDNHDLIFPVPISEINTNPILTQNTGF
ncbi:MAG TPA: RagB/SusD family nutrient uptake outer membrane protein [Puia sp.]|nr:RagB/SusD family nutrient uptake outer membrane protein [Puia sp.]